MAGGRLLSLSNVVTRQPGSNTSAASICAAGKRIPNACGGTGGQIVGMVRCLWANHVSGPAKPGIRRQLAFPWRDLAAVLLGLAACNPVDTWRDLTGTSRNDPDPETTPNTKNLAAGEASDYPNLATVPPPPVRALTAAEREKLTQSLIADRENARHSDEQLRAGSRRSRRRRPLAPPDRPGIQPQSRPRSPPDLERVASQPPVAPPRSCLPQRRWREPPTRRAGKPARALPAAAAARHCPSGRAERRRLKAAQRRRRSAARAARSGGKTARPNLGKACASRASPPSRDRWNRASRCRRRERRRSPSRSQPPPPPPQLPPTPRVATAPTPLPGGLAAGGALAPIPLPQAKTSAGYEPPPAPPELPPVPPTRTAAAGPGKGSAKPPAPVGDTGCRDQVRRRFDHPDRQGSANPRNGPAGLSAEPGKGSHRRLCRGRSGAVEQLDSYRTALDRAQAVAAALTEGGDTVRQDPGRGGASRAIIPAKAAPRCCSNTEAGSRFGAAQAACRALYAGGGFLGAARECYRKIDAGRYKETGSHAAVAAALRLAHRIRVAVVKPPFKIAIAGLGTVGSGVLQLLDRQADPAGPARRPAHRRRRSLGARPPARPRRRSVGRALVRGRRGDGGRSRDRRRRRADRRRRRHRARRCVETALDHGKHVVTANKALMAHDGTRLAARAEEKGVIAARSRPRSPAASRSSRGCAKASPATGSRASTASSTAPRTTS